MSDNVAGIIGLVCIISFPAMVLVYLAWVEWLDKGDY